jgi:hypothetical protein
MKFAWMVIFLGVFNIAAGMVSDLRGIQLGSARSGGSVTGIQIECAGVVMLVAGVFILRKAKKK